MVAAAAMVAPAFADEIVIGTNGKPGNPRVSGAEMFGALLEQASGGEHTVNVAHSATLGDDRQMLQSVRLGTMQITVNSDGPVSEIVPDLSAFGLPYLFTNLPQAWEVLDGPIGDDIAAQLEDKGYVVLAWWDNGLRQITHTSKAIETPKDIVGMRIRTPQSQVTIDAFTALGANPAPLSFSELPAALQSGVFEGQENPLANIYSSRLHELTPYIALSNHKYEMAPILASKRWWDTLSEDDQSMIQTAMDAATWYNRGVFLISDFELTQKLIEEGAFINEVDVEAFKAATAGVYTSWEEQLGDIVPRIQAAAAAAAR
ncbi:putative TRAP transporter extracellular solute-binding protein [Octadecabacter arcticus 238]|jgi:tripartite ATP-independent transporter DctP family solute receptor|uniref:Putative TRAP transporter extracellular solute-binding protein n=1 Tax=Octadecabacter arcticus 238 TaxID=391616 RepID=M9RW88_9RHOB|nr:TRAP transporter substrate-binding protein [Octadecabacter arcticus]AGI74140.1 putative TRAP transporter extracellular solute-binding protein [Octadecabacter arcticus 238]